jgi:hypothetical protein
MFGDNRSRLLTIRCVTCGRWVAIRVDVDDLRRHVRDGIRVQHAFVDGAAKPYLSAAEREMFVSRVCGDCWIALCPSDKLAYS